MRIYPSKLVLTALAGMALVGAPSLAHAQAQTYKLDAAHTAITWHIDHFGFSKPSGKFMNVEGSVTLDQDNPANSHVEVTIPVAKVNTGVPELDEHLIGPDFFDAAQFPTATFKSTHVTITGEHSADVTGDLTLHGVTKPVTLQVKLNRMAENMFKKQTAGFTASTTLKRSDFGMTTYLPNLGDEITIEIESEANM